MEEEEHSTQPCPYCAEEIATAAVRCPHCRSRLLAPGRWHRDHDARRMAGVASGLAHALALPVTPVRLAFVVLTFVHLVGPLLYLALWLVMPYSAGDEPPYAQILVRAKRFWEQLGGHRGGHGNGSAGSPRPPSPPGASGTDVGGPVT